MATIHPEYRAIFDAHMHGGEALLWAGRPIGKARDTRFRLPFVFAIVWLVGMCLMAFLGHVPAGFMMLPNLIGILFILFPFVLITAGVIMLAISWQNLTRPRYMDYAVDNPTCLLWRDRRKRSI